MCKILAVTALLIVTSSVSLADEPRWRDLFVSENSKFEAKLTDRTWRLTEKSTGTGLYTFDDYYDKALWLHSMTLVIANNGRSVVAVNDFAEQPYEWNPDVLFFFRDGKLVKRYRLSEVADTRFIEVSVSHFHWLYFPNKLTISQPDSQIEIVTFEMNHIIFNTEDGSLKSKKLDDLFSKGAIFVFGDVLVFGKNQYEVIVDCSIHGSAKRKERIKFESTKFGWVGGGSNESLILLDGHLIQKAGVIFNMCH